MNDTLRSLFIELTTKSIIRPHAIEVRDYDIDYVEWLGRVREALNGKEGETVVRWHKESGTSYG